MKIFDGGLNLTKPVYVGIDQSYSGFAITMLNDTGYKTTVFKSSLKGILRLSDIQAHLYQQLEQLVILDVAMEGYAFGSQMANMLGELGGMVKLVLLELGQYPLIVPPTSLKKYVAGKGAGVSKSQMMLFTYKNFGVDLPDDNAADSYGLAHLVSGNYTHAYQKEVYTKLNDPKYREK
jgi:hypothetical protein